MKLLIISLVSILLLIIGIPLHLLCLIFRRTLSSSTSTAGAQIKAKTRPLTTNCRVILKNLEKAPEYNGKVGVVVGELDPQDNRLSVKLSSNAMILRVRPENLEDASSPIRRQPASISPLQMGADRWDPGSLDPSKLPEWAGGSLGQAFSNFQFSLNEALASRAGHRPARGTDPAHDVKETLLILARLLDSGKGATMLLQDDAQDEGVAIRVAAVLACDGGTDQPRPLLVVHHWSEGADSPSLDRSMRSLMAAVRPGPGFRQLSVTAAEIAALRALLTYNAARLDPAWAAAQAVPDAFSLSYLAPLGRPAAEKERPDCVCGAKAPKRRCTRCGIKWYCSKECQVPLPPPE